MDALSGYCQYMRMHISVKIMKGVWKILDVDICLKCLLQYQRLRFKLENGDDGKIVLLHLVASIIICKEKVM